MRRLAIACVSALVFVSVATSVLAASNPIPGIGVVIKKGSSSAATRVTFGTGSLPEVPANFFDPGSEPFSGTVALDPVCGFPCGPCGCDESRIDYSTETPAGPFDTEMLPITLRSVSPITVTNASGVDSFFDVWVEVLGSGGASTISGSLTIQPGALLVPGTSTFVVDSFFDITYRISFTEPGSMAPVSPPLTGDLRLDMQTTDMPITCYDDGSSTGVFLLGISAQGGNVPIILADVQATLSLELDSVFSPPVSGGKTSWSNLKSRF